MEENEENTAPCQAQGEETDTDLVDLFNALLKAKQAFDKYFEDNNLEGAYWDLELSGWVLDAEFRRWKKITLSRDESLAQPPPCGCKGECSE